MENTSIYKSLKALFIHYTNVAESVKAIEETSAILFNEGSEFLERSKALDVWLSKNNKYEELGDVLFDMLMVHYLAEELHEPDYFDSQEWNEIENKTLDKGSEMLNVYLYLSEAKENEIEPHLEDFLTEFLLVGEDEFQDEYRIYESLIVNEDILDADLDGIRQIQKSVKEDTGLYDYFIPLVFFFQYAEGLVDEGEWNEGLSGFERAVLQALIAFKEN